MKKSVLFVVFSVLWILESVAQTGVKVEIPLEDLHVNGTMQVTKDIKVGGSDVVKGDPGKAGQMLKSNGSGKAASWVTIAVPEVPATSSGSLIAVNGKMQIAEEITYLMTDDYIYPNTAEEPLPITTINNKIIDTYGNLKDGAFKVAEDGVYLVTLNAQISYITFGDDEKYRGKGTELNPDLTESVRPVIGIWDEETMNTTTNKLGQWLARVNDTYTALPNDLLLSKNHHKNADNAQTYTLTTAVSLKAGKKYSFRVIVAFTKKKHSLIVKALSAGNSGSGPVSYFSVKRLN